MGDRASKEREPELPKPAPRPPKPRLPQPAASESQVNLRFGSNDSGGSKTRRSDQMVDGAVGGLPADKGDTGPRKPRQPRPAESESPSEPRQSRPAASESISDQIVDGSVGGLSADKEDTGISDQIVDGSVGGLSADKEDTGYTEGLIRKSQDPSRTVVRLKSPKESALLVVAIDFGTTYSGYGYSFKADKDSIFTNTWNGAELKTTTEVLLTPQQEFHAFGLGAREEYKELIETGDYEEWYFFSRFKMKLFVRDGPLTLDMVIEDITGKEMLAVDVFAAAIRFMVEHCKGVLNQREQNVRVKSDSDIHWILTVPAIWDDLSKQFMRKAAVLAGIRDDMLSLALEPEAASLFCKKEFKDIKITAGTKYLVLDLGGGTADITCHQVNPDGTLKELHKPTGGNFGGTSVDEHFMVILQKLFGGKVLKEFMKQTMNEYWEMIQAFERKKRTFDGSNKIKLQFPVNLLDLHEAETDEPITETLKTSTLRGKVEFKIGRMFIEHELSLELFDETVDKIRLAVQEIVDKIDGIEHIILVGGFSESLYIQKVMRDHFKNLIRIPEEPTGAVVKGAVIYGHETKAISSRVCKFTYGIGRMMKFKPGIHPERKAIKMEGMTYCDDLFNKHIEIGKTVSVDSGDQAEEHEYFPSVDFMKQAVLEVYASTEKNPQFIDDDGCHFMGLIKVDIDPQGDIWLKLKVKLIFGGTELIVQVHDVKSNTVTIGKVEFWG